MTKLKYVGLKQDGETAFSTETNITWFPGSVEDVPDAVAERMLKHPDVFAVDDEPLTGDQVDIPRSTILLADGTSLTLNGFDKSTLHAIAKENGVNVHHNAGADKVIAALIAAYPVK